MIRIWWTIAANAFREAVRDKILYNIAFFALGLILFSLLLGEWTVFARDKVVKDFTLAVMSVGGLCMAIFLGIGLIQKEIQRKTVLTLLAKPMPRWHFIVGKYLGLLLVLAVNLAAMAAAFYAVLWATGCQPQWKLLQAIYLIYVEMALLVALALLFSTFSTPVLSALLTFGVYVAGHLSGDILNHLAFMDRYANRMPGSALPPWVSALAKAAYYVLPNLETFNLKGRVVYDLPVPGHYLLMGTGYGLCYIVVFLAISCWWFNRRDFL